MSEITILLMALAAMIALGLVFFKYFFGNKNRGRNTYFLATLRFLTIFILLMLIINPEIKKQTLEIQKPSLLIAVDLSKSIDYAEKADTVRSYVNLLRSNLDLLERFNIQTYGFGSEVERLGDDNFEFEKTQSNIANAVKNLDRLSGNNQNAIVLITDGNQTLGEDFVYYSAKENTAVIPVVAGDTTAQIDLSISNLNVNKYAFLNNNFPVEVILNYTGIEEVETNFQISSGNSVLFSKKIKFSPEDNSEVVTTTLSANKLGTSLYQAVVEPVAFEKNITNNSRRFGVEVIDERTSVLILSSVSHPDLGMFKKSIEQNEQREAKIESIENYKSLNLSDFQLIIVYQPKRNFKQVFDDLESQNVNSLVISGTQTDWNFLNEIQQIFQKDFSYQTQEIFPQYNRNYSQFQFENIGFEEFPPLEDAFGNLEVLNSAFNPMLFQQVEGIETNLPLLATIEKNSIKQGFLFGENIWKWRSQSFVDTGSFEQFDTFIGKVVQYLTGTQKRNRLTVENETVYLENENILISAQYFDQNYMFNSNGQLEIRIENIYTGKELRASMLPENNRFKFEVENLKAGDYKFEIKEQTSGISRQGNFTVLEYNVEQQFTSANSSKLKLLADNNSSELFYLNDPQGLIQYLLQQDRFISVQKSREKSVPLIDWKLLLVLLVLFLGTEWFMRKYFGLI